MSSSPLVLIARRNESNWSSRILRFPGSENVVGLCCCRTLHGTSQIWWWHLQVLELSAAAVTSVTTTMIWNGHRFLCHPYRSWELHDSIKYQCPGVTVPKCRRFWRALICFISLSFFYVTIEVLKLWRVARTPQTTKSIQELRVPLGVGKILVQQQQFIFIAKDVHFKGFAD